MSLVTRYPGVRHRIVHDKEEVCVIDSGNLRGGPCQIRLQFCSA